MVSERRHFLPTQHTRSLRMRKRSSLPAALLRTYPTRACRGQRATRDATSVEASTASPAYRQCLRRAWWLSFSCYWVVALSVYQGAYTALQAKGGSSLLTRLLVAYTHQAIVVLLAKLTNPPTKLHTGCIALWGSGACLHSCYVEST